MKYLIIVIITLFAIICIYFYGFSQGEKSKMNEYLENSINNNIVNNSENEESKNKYPEKNLIFDWNKICGN